jgi:hypothetical protein
VLSGRGIDRCPLVPSVPSSRHHAADRTQDRGTLYSPFIIIFHLWLSALSPGPEYRSTPHSVGYPATPSPPRLEYSSHCLSSSSHGVHFNLIQYKYIESTHQFNSIQSNQTCNTSPTLYVCVSMYLCIRVIFDILSFPPSVPFLFFLVSVSASVPSVLGF